MQALLSSHGPGNGLSDLLVPLVTGPLRELLTATSVAGLPADRLTVSFSDTCGTKMLVTDDFVRDKQPSGSAPVWMDSQSQFCLSEHMSEPY